MLVGDPVCDVGGVGRWQSEDDVLEVGVDRFADCVLGDAGLVVGDWQVDRAGDRGGGATDLGAVARPTPGGLGAGDGRPHPRGLWQSRPECSCWSWLPYPAS